MEQPTLVVTWDEYLALIESLARLVRDSGYAPDQIVAIPKGGNLPGDILARLFRIPIGYLPAASYENRERKSGIVFSRTLASTTPGIGERLLIVDDLDDTGRTLIAAREWLVANAPGVREMRTAVLWHKTCSEHRPSFHAVTVEPTDGKWPWIIQPFERYERQDIRDL